MYKKLIFEKKSDHRGDLIPVEFGSGYDSSDIDFDVKRCFFIFPKTRETRGSHAHRWVEQVLICLDGSMDICLKNGKGDQYTISLDKPNVGIYIPKLIWNELLNFSENCKLLVLASDHYHEREYINNYEEFKRIVAEEN